MGRALATINVSMPKVLRNGIRRKVSREAYRSASEYVCELIRKDLRTEAIERVDRLLLEGLDSPAEPFDRKWLVELKRGGVKKTRRSAPA